MLPDLHHALKAVFVIDTAGYPDRLVGRAEMRVSANLQGDLAAKAAELGQILALGRFSQLPPDMQLAGTTGGATTAFDD